MFCNMAKIFDVQDWLKNHPNRNNFDLSHKVHGSYKMGKLYPFFCRPVVPTDSFQIDTECSFRFTPMPFPTQSNMRVIFHYFYVRNKNIWKNFENWIEGVEEHEPPYIMQSPSFYHRSSLADYLGIPSSFVIGTHNSSFDGDIWFGDRNLVDDSSLTTAYPLLGSGGLIYDNDPRLLLGSIPNFDILWNDAQRHSAHNFVFRLCETGGREMLPVEVLDIDNVKFDYVVNSQSYINLADAHVYLLGVNSNGYAAHYLDLGTNNFDSTSFDVAPITQIVNDDYFHGSLKYYLIIYFQISHEGNPSVSTPVVGPFVSLSNFSLVSVSAGGDVNVDDDGVACPYYGSNNTSSNSIKVSALPFRAYESVYNAFYRNSQGVQPFQVDGVTKYNQYITNDGDGADTTDYHLFNRNWELDAYTSCLISPQQGHVPYVGITDISALGRMSVETPDGHTADVTLSDNGDGVDIRDLHGETPEARAYALRTASLGFTIPEFREANALQRFLEMNIRKGYKYIDFIEGHFGVKPKYNELDMPEFIGGFTQRISVNEISNTNGGTTAEELGDTLGAIAGQARAIGRSGRSVRHYFDDFGFVIGIMCIVPDNAYDSILPKHFNLKNPLDMYFPEFSQLSYMPLTHEELAPLQTINDPRGSAYHDLTKVFGYQRPNHDLVWYPDSVHGLFRDASGIGNSVICRRFGQRPELSNDFLTIKPEETDTIFNYTFGDEDVCLGEIALRIAAKRPIPRLVVPQIS